LGRGIADSTQHFPVVIFPLSIYFYITKKTHNNNRKGVCVLPSPRWGGAGGEVVKTQKFPSLHEKAPPVKAMLKEALINSLEADLR